MNVVDFLLEHSGSLDKEVIANREWPLRYRVLQQEVSHLAGWLQQHIPHRSRILLIAENSPFFVLAYLGILKSGHICVPLNPGISEPSLQHIIQQCEATTGFVQRKFSGKLAPLLDTLIAEPALQAACRQERPFTPETGFDGNRVAKILFTSGSTALPKGVMLSHNNIIANTRSIVEYLQLSSVDRMLVVLPFYYCYGLSLLHTHLRAGGSLVFNNTFIMLNTVLEDLIGYRCSGFAGVPSHFQILIRKYRKFREAQLPDLRYVTQAGGKLPDVFIEEFTATFPEIDFVVMYGQTEATSRLSYLPPQLLKSKPGSIGKGIPGVELLVADIDGKPVVPGETGHLLARGDNVMLGYFLDEELSEATLQNNYLRTGDLATVDEEGYIYIVAREKEFLKVGGERVSPKEIEAVIAALPEVVDCSIIGVQDDIAGEAIKAFVVLCEGATLSGKEVINHCNRHLSASKIPSFVEFISDIPVNTAGKKIKAQLEALNTQS